MRTLLATCAVAIAATLGLPAAAAAAPRVLDTFEVGANVYVRALRLDRRAGAMWVGTSSGAHRVDLASLKPTRTLTRADGLANEYVFAIGIDALGDTWLGTNAGGATRLRGAETKTFFPMHGLADYWVYAFANQRDGTLWIGTWAGANRVDPRTARFRTYVKELVNEWVYGLAVDSRDRVWFATEGGVSMHDGRRWRSWTHRDGLGATNDAGLAPSLNTGLGTRQRHDLTTLREGAPTYNPGYVFAIHVDPQDIVWAGTWGGGVARFDGTRWTNLTVRDGLAGGIVYSIAQDATGAFWFGTDRGVSRWDGRQWHTIDKAAGLLDDHVYALAVAPDGVVWAGTRRGVARIQP